MIDILSPDFIDSFDITKATVGIVGYGYVGQAVDHFFNRHCRTVIYDKAKPELNTLKDVISSAEVIFISVPTPMRADGSCYTGIVESVIADIRNEALNQNRNLDSFVCVIKSTIPPGFTDSMSEKYFGMRITFSPEFLSEKTAIADFLQANRIIVGGDEDDALVVCKYFASVQPKRFEDGKLMLLSCPTKTAEMVKLFTNGILATKVIFSNEMYQLCEKLGISYEEVRALVSLDSRVGASHTIVPGPSGGFGFSGSCFPKDISSLRHLCRVNGVPERLFTAVIDRNIDLRPDKDWEKLPGRAVIDV